MPQLTITSPFDNSVITTIQKHSAEDAEQMLQSALAALKNPLPLYIRIEILERLAAAMEPLKDELAMLIAIEGGKPLIDAQIEVARAIGGVKLAIGEITHLGGKQIPMGLTKASANRLAFTTIEPIGVIIAISAFNHPLNLIIHQIIPAIATGCPIIIKPDSRTPLSCLKLLELLKHAGLPNGWVQACICDHDIAEKLATDSRIGLLSFIGSARVGWYLRSKLAAGVRCQLEHGGVAPVIFDETADIDTYAPALIKGAFYHAGQVCVSTKRIYAHKSIATELAEKLAYLAKNLVVGDPTIITTQVGPLITTGELERVNGWVQEAIHSGANMLCGSKPLSATTYAPTVLFDAPDDAKVSTLETFGPVLCVYSYDDLNLAVERANNVPYSFQASIFSNDLTRTMALAKHLNASAIMINDHTAFRMDWMPFAGYKQSGLGVGGIGYTMREMVQEKMVVFS
jgi:acyl-CoA reductase-like NAD-dependent aldehyde dehydrogenase